MTHKLKQDDPDIACAKTILDKGWRQGAIFDPRGIIQDIQLTNGELFILCTQSCTVVSSRFATDPIVEAMVVKLLPKYNPRAFEATGKNQRKLHIEVIGSSEFKCIECDINRRFFFDRHLLLNINPLHEFEIGMEGSTRLAGWLGRSYTRIALPNLLVERVKPELLTLILKCLDEKQTHGQNKGSPIHESVSFIYLDWQPRADIADLFELKFIFLCSDAQTEEMLEKNLLEKLEPYQDEAGKHGVRISNVICRTPNTTFLTDLNGYERYSELDFLSELGEIAQAPPKMMREKQ
jgi:hypothetical protein